MLQSSRRSVLCWSWMSQSQNRATGIPYCIYSWFALRIPFGMHWFPVSFLQASGIMFPTLSHIIKIQKNWRYSKRVPQIFRKFITEPFSRKSWNHVFHPHLSRRSAFAHDSPFTRSNCTRFCTVRDSCFLRCLTLQKFTKIKYTLIKLLKFFETL